MDIFSAIEKYGIAMVFVVVFFIVAWQLLKKLLKVQSDRITELKDMVEELMDKNTDDNENIFGSHAEFADKVQILLYHMLNRIKANRISIFEYHNGGKTIKGVSFKRCTNTYEALSLNITPKKIQLQNLPISINTLWYKNLLDKKDVIIPDTEKLENTDPILWSMFMSDCIVSYYSFLIIDFDGKPIGFITMEFCDEKIDLNDEQIKDLKNNIITIAGLIG